MPVVGTKAAASAQGFGEFAQASTTATYIENVFSTYLYTGNGSNQSISNGIGLGPSYSGVSGGAAQFTSASTQYCTVPNSSLFAFGSGNFTIEAMVYPTNSNTFCIAYKGSGSTFAPFGFLVTPGYGATLYASTSGSSWEIVASNNCNVPLNTWTHIAAVRNGSDFTVYINGAAGVAVSNSSALVANSQATGLGACNDGTYPAGARISNLRIVKGTAVYTTPFTPPSAALTAVSGSSLLCFQGSTPFTDNSGNSVAITQVNSPTSSTTGPFPQVAGSGGLVWLKSRVATAAGGGSAFNQLFDNSASQNSGFYQPLYSNTTDAAGLYPGSVYGGVSNFNGDGFSLSPGIFSNPYGNESSKTYASWTFRKQPKFFDIVTYTGNGVSGRQIAHNLGSTPGCIIVKCTSTATVWPVYHRILGGTNYLRLNTTDVATANSTFWNNTDPTSTVFTVGNAQGTNQNTATYVAYLFAHNAGGFGLTGTDNVITCDYYIGNGSANGPVVNLGYEPQWLLIKKTGSSGGAWWITDTMRGFSVTSDQFLWANSATNEIPKTNYVKPTATGFQIVNADFDVNESGEGYIYIAIRRGPMKTPTSGTSVFAPALASSSGTYTATSNFPVDWAIEGQRAGSTKFYAGTRLTGDNTLQPNTTGAESAQSWGFDNMTGYTLPGVVGDYSGFINWMMRRAPGFFDVVCYTGTGVARTINHNLGVVPELMIVKDRSAARNWPVYAAPLGNTGYFNLNGNYPSFTGATIWNSTTPTSTVFSVDGSSVVNASGDNYVAYLFASCPGVSKVGTYTGNGSTQTINCGFTGGARFVWLQRTSNTTNTQRYIFDTARGMTTSTDPWLSLNSTAAESATTGACTTTAVGFSVDASKVSDVNASGETYLYLAIA